MSVANLFEDDLLDVLFLNKPPGRNLARDPKSVAKEQYAEDSIEKWLKKNTKGNS